MRTYEVIFAVLFWWVVIIGAMFTPIDNRGIIGCIAVLGMQSVFIHYAHKRGKH